MLELSEQKAAESLEGALAYLAPDVKLEPLVDRWYAWPHLLAPAQQALNLAHRYLPTVRSFLSEPELHAETAADPSFYGGPFLELPVAATGAVAEYLRDTEVARSEALAFAREFRDFDGVIQAAAGFSLDELRKRTPPRLKGRTELAYDLGNHPKLRLLEEMFEADDLGHAAAQAVVLHRLPDTRRPFFLSTPRLDSFPGLFLHRPFGSAAIQALAASRTTGVSVRDLAAELGCDAAALGGYFSPDPPPPSPPYKGAGVRIRYFGHACLLIETDRQTILVDPTFAVDRDLACPHLTLQDLPARIDVLILSHGHQDHLCPEALMQLRDRVGVTLLPPHNHGEPSDPSPRRILRMLGFQSLVTLDPLDRYELADGAITALPFSGEHCDLDIHSKQCVLLELQGRRIGLLVDSDAIDLEVYRRLAPRLQDLDVLFIGMECFGAPLSWLYGPLMSRPIARGFDNSRRLSAANCSRAQDLIGLLNPGEVAIYAMGQEPWMKHLMGLNYREDSIQLRESDELLRWCSARGTPADRIFMSFEKEL